MDKPETAPLDIEMIYDPVAEAHAEGLVIDASRHRIMADGDFILWARRHYKRPTLFEYHHLESDNIVLCDWLIRGKVAQELEAYSYGNRPDRAFLDARIVLCDKSAESIRRKMRNSAYERQRLRDESLAERQDVAKQLRRQGLEMEARRMATGASPFVGKAEGGEELAAMKEDLVNMARGRIITHG
jgi:hypothetical protein